MTDLGELLGIRHPIVLAPFGGLSSVALTAAVSDAGGLGSYGLYGYAGERIRTTAAALREATAAPFALNIWLPTGDEVAPGPEHDGYAAALDAFFAEVGIERPPRPERYLPSLDEQLDAIWEAAPAVLSVVFGVPSASVVEEAHRRGIRVVGAATTVAEAVALADSGVDAVVATGSEAAGHRVSFLRPAEDSLVGLISLVPQVVDAVDVPVLAAGGIGNGRQMAAGMALGAEGVWTGSLWLTVEEADTPEMAKRRILEATSRDTVRSRSWTGKPARLLRNEWTEAWESAESPGTLPMPLQFMLVSDALRRIGRSDASELATFPAGQIIGLMNQVRSTKDVIFNLMAEYGEALERLERITED